MSQELVFHLTLWKYSKPIGAIENGGNGVDRVNAEYMSGMDLIGIKKGP